MLGFVVNKNLWYKSLKNSGLENNIRSHILIYSHVQVPLHDLTQVNEVLIKMVLIRNNNNVTHKVYVVGGTK